MLHVRFKTAYLEDGEEVAAKMNRRVFDPGRDADATEIDNLPVTAQLVKDIKNLVWTQAVIDARKAVLAAQTP